MTNICPVYYYTHTQKIYVFLKDRCRNRRNTVMMKVCELPQKQVLQVQPNIPGGVYTMSSQIIVEVWKWQYVS